MSDMGKGKAVRVNLSTKTTDIITTMREEMPSAMYFFRKQFGGNNKYKKYEESMLDKALAEEQDQLTDIDYYISPVGNRWMSYTHVVYYPRAKYAQAFQYSFIYYETLGSCGAFFPMYSPKQVKDGLVKPKGQPDGVLVFTSHFFYQMSERTGIEYRSKELIKKFISEKCENGMSTYADGDVIAKFKGGHGFGKELSVEPRKVEVRTYLTDGQLSNKQKRKCEAVDALNELTKDGLFMKDVAIHTAYHQVEDPEMAARDGRKRYEAMKKLGMEDHVAMMMGLSLGFIHALEVMLDMKVTEQQSSVIGCVVSENAMDIVQKYASLDVVTAQQNAEFERDVLELYVKCARQMKLKAITRERIEEYFRHLKDEARQDMN